MSRRQPYLPQRQIGSDVFTNNGIDKVVGLMNVPFQNPIVPGSVPYVDLNGIQIDWMTVLPVSVIPTIPASLLPQANEVEFNYRFQGGF